MNAWTAQACKNQFLDDDGYCPDCGKNHFSTSKAAVKKVELEASKAARIEAAIESNPIYREARAMVKKMSEDCGLPVKVIFHNMSGSLHKRTPSGEHVICFGYQSAETAFKQFSEYASLQYLVSSKKKSGLDGVRLLAIHEFAHAVDVHENGRMYGVSHGPTYVKVYRTLLDLYAE